MDQIIESDSEEFWILFKLWKEFGKQTTTLPNSSEKVINYSDLISETVEESL